MKKIASIFLCVAMLCSMLGITAHAAGGFSSAQSYVMGTTVNESAAGNDGARVYKFSVSGSGRISLNFFANAPRIFLELFDASGSSVWSKSLSNADIKKGITLNQDWFLNSGVYYLSVKSYNYIGGSYQFKMTEIVVNETFREGQGGNNNTVTAANFITFGNTYLGCLSLNDDIDIYKFTMHESGEMAFTFKSSSSYVDVEVFDENGTQLWFKHISNEDKTKAINFQEDFHLRKGTYYISMKGSSGSYNYSFAFTSANEIFAEEHPLQAANAGSLFAIIPNNNDTVETANTITINRRYSGQIALKDKKDIYKVYLSGGDVRIGVYAQMPNVSVSISSATDHDLKFFSSTLGDNDGDGKINLFEACKVPAAGTYYVTVSSTGYGSYSLYLTNGGQVTDAAYNGKVITVKVNGRYIPFEQPPVLENGTTLVPLRAIFEALNATVQWEASTRTITSIKGGTKIVMQIGSNKMYVNGVQKTLNVPAKLINGNTMVPVRAISEAFKCKVSWDGVNRTVIVQ